MDGADLIRPVDGVDLLLRRLELRDAVTESERAALRAAAGLAERYTAHTTIVPEYVPQTFSRLVAKGYVARVKMLPDGGRQITALHMPGDFVDLHSFLLKRMDHDIVALCDVEMVTFPHEALKRITEDQPHLTRMLWLMTLVEASIQREWIANAGRKTALEQVASLFCEIMLRHRVVGLSDGRTVPFPLTQTDLADACGLSPVHINRVVQELRETGLVQWRARRLTITDFDRLAELALFDPSFLILNREPR